MLTLRRYSYALLAMGRPLFLMGTVPLYGVGVAAAYHDTDTLNPSSLVLGLLLVWLIQLMTHYNNEYCDLESDRAHQAPTFISGGSRVLVRGLVPAATARGAALICLSLAVILTLGLVVGYGAGAFLLLLVGPAFFLGWFYSAPPLKLEARGLGEATIVLTSCFLLPMTGYYLQTASLAPALLLLGTALGFLTFALTLVTELPDVAADIATGKLTLAARLGSKATLLVQLVSFGLGWLSLAAMLLYLAPVWAWVLILVSTPWAAMVLLMAGRASKGRRAAVEWLGVGIALLLGYASFAISGVLLLG